MDKRAPEDVAIDALTHPRGFVPFLDDTTAFYIVQELLDAGLKIEHAGIDLTPDVRR